MKHQPARGRTGRMLAHSCKLLSIAAITACSFLPSGADAQPYYNSQVHTLRDNQNFFSSVKGFSTEMVVGSNDESIMAGTMYDNDGNFGYPVFVHLSPGGNINSNGIMTDYPDILPNSINGLPFQSYDHPDYYDERVVDVVVGGVINSVQTYFIIVAARQDPAVFGAAARDKIRVIAVDYEGTPNPVFFGGNYHIEYEDTRTSPGEHGLYPVHGMYKSGVPGGGNTNDILYICGYVTQTNTTGSATPPTTIPNPATSPGLEAPKAAFVMNIDATPGPTIGFVNYYRNYDYTPVVAATQPFDPYDFDMAVRMTPLSANYTNYIAPGHIHVTGSVNSVTGATNGITPGGWYVNRSATMNMVIDQWDLSVQNSGHFISTHMNSDGMGRSEYGVGFIENTYFNTGLSAWRCDNYIVSNLYEGYPGGYAQWITPNASPDFPQLFNIRPDVMTITHTGSLGITATLPNPSHQQRLKTDIGWALHVLESTKTTTSGSLSARTMLVAGMTRTNYDPNNPFIWASDNNILPWLFDADVEFTSPGNIVGATQFVPIPSTQDMRIYNNQAGTSNPTLTFDYLHMGNNLSSVLFGPTFANRTDNTRNIVFNAPRVYEDPQGMVIPVKSLGLKTSFADKFSDIYTPTCNWHVSPGPHAEDIQPYNEGVTFTVSTNDYASDIWWTLGGHLLPVNNVVYHRGDCYGTSGYDTWNQPVYKQGNVSVLSRKAPVTTVFPNPATTEVNVSLAKDIADDATVKVVLSNMHGQVVKELYNGEALAIGNTSLSLPQVATGLYIVQVFSNGAIVHQQKLSIQQ